MMGSLPGETSHHGTSGSGTSGNSQDRPEELGTRWYFTRKEIEENSPSRRDEIDLKKETYLRKSYCTFLQDLGMRLKVPQVTIATAIMFCHRFFILQSHAKNDRRVIGTVCMFLAGKVEETPRPLKDVIMVSYEVTHKKDPDAAQRIKQKEVYEQQKELILTGEKLVLTTLGFDLNVHHPYKPLVEAIKKFKVAQNTLAQVAWNFVNDGLRTSLCLQFKPHHIAAGAIFLAAKFLKVKLPSEGDKVWWQEFDVSPRQLEEVSNQMLELYEQNRVPLSQGSEAEGSVAGGSSQWAPVKTPSTNEEHASKQASSRSAPEHSVNHHGTHTQNGYNDSGSGETESVITDQKVDFETKGNQHREHVSSKHTTGAAHKDEEEQQRSGRRSEVADTGECRDDAVSQKSSSILDRGNIKEGPVSQSPKEAIKMIDKDKVKAKLEKRRKSRGETTRKRDFMDEDDLIERELEDGIELAAEDKTKRERGQGKVEQRNHVTSKGYEAENIEEGEMLDEGSPMSNNRKRKSESQERQAETKKRHDYTLNHNHDAAEEKYKTGRSAY